MDGRCKSGPPALILEVVVNEQTFRSIVAKNNGHIAASAKELGIGLSKAYHIAKKLSMKADGRAFRWNRTLRLDVAKAIVKANGNMNGAAAILGISRERVRQLFNKTIKGV